jgi:hypothetical protein
MGFMGRVSRKLAPGRVLLRQPPGQQGCWHPPKTTSSRKADKQETAVLLLCSGSKPTVCSGWSKQPVQVSKTAKQVVGIGLIPTHRRTRNMVVQERV